jgi:hypothetical protein
MSLIRTKTNAIRHTVIIMVKPMIWRLKTWISRWISDLRYFRFTISEAYRESMLVASKFKVDKERMS